MTNLTALNPLWNNPNSAEGYAVFLPAIQPFYARTAAGQVSDKRAYPPTFLTNGYESLDFFNPNRGMFSYKWGLCSAGVAELDLDKARQREPMIINARKNGAWLFGDSGGYQVATNKLKWNSDSPAELDEFRQLSERWMNECASVMMPLDFPTTKRLNPGERRSFDEALQKTLDSLDFMQRNHVRRPDDIIMNVVQGVTQEEQLAWVDAVKTYSSDGWAMPWRAHGSVHALLEVLLEMEERGCFKNCRLLHIFGLSRMHFAGALTLLMRAMRQRHPELLITYDSATPFLLAAKHRQAYTTWQIEKHRGEGIYGRAEPTIRDIGTFTFAHVPVPVEAEHRGSRERFPALTSPFGLNLTLGDVCVREVPTTQRGSAWDHLSSAMVAAHNVYCHVLAVTQMNVLMDRELCGTPAMPLSHMFQDFQEVVNRAFEPGRSLASAQTIIASNKDVLQFFDRRSVVEMTALYGGELPDWSSTDLEEFPELVEMPYMHE